MLTTKMFNDLIFISLLFIFSCNSTPISNLKPLVLAQKVLITQQNATVLSSSTQTNFQSSANTFLVTYGPCNSSVCPAPQGYCSTSTQCTYLNN